jgi:hypothetical protein
VLQPPDALALFWVGRGVVAELVALKDCSLVFLLLQESKTLSEESLTPEGLLPVLA